jgi:hypothetical protein
MSHGTCNPPKFTSHGTISGGDFTSHGTCNSIPSALSHASRLSAFGCLRHPNRRFDFKHPAATTQATTLNCSLEWYANMSVMLSLTYSACITATDLPQQSFRTINAPDCHHPTIPKPKPCARDTDTEDNSTLLVTNLADGARLGIDVEWDQNLHRLGATTLARRIAPLPQLLAIAVGG